MQPKKGWVGRHLNVLQSNAREEFRLIIHSRDGPVPITVNFSRT